MAGVWRWEQQKGDVGKALRCWQQKRPPCMTACRETETDVDRLKFKGKNRHYLEPHSKVGISN